MPTRRTLLRKAGVMGIGTAIGVATLPSPPESTTTGGTVEGAGPSAVVTPWDDEVIGDENDAPIARYQYRPRRGGEFAPTAPVNVVLLPDRGRLERVMGVLENAGWLRNVEEYTRYAWDSETARYVRQQASAAETYYGTSGRRHVRCWAFDGVVSMQAHEDTGARPKHGIASYERGRETVETLYAADGWSVSPGAIDLDNAKAPDHDGVATVIAEAP
ncbi:hypothetical protein [Halosolutus gelatinilyticus]|uniref:hypothetical protein n=1 Tax=Halosolutus gelatinilyticus TaxID=2931975 RepID=UPI001FF6788B|nr:hypothetical protein [Halosolutus gelatinilyticus]